MLILGIDTSTHICSVALAENGHTLDVIENNEGQAHASLITMQVKELLSRNHYSMGNLSAVAVSGGPGSYTGLRIGVSAAKGLCYALDIPLIAVPTLEALAWAAITKKNNEQAFYMPMIDAMRMEVYTAVYTHELICEEIPHALVVTPSALEPYFSSQTCYYFGTGAAKCTSVLQNSNAVYLSDIECSAANLSKLAVEHYLAGNTADIAYFFPDYIKKFASN